jgi:cytochrome c biogenesis protein
MDQTTEDKPDTPTQDPRQQPKSQSGPQPKPQPDTPDLSAGEFLARLAALTYSKTIGLVLILVMAALVLLGAVISQAPAGTYSDEAARAQFLAAAQTRYGGWTRILDFLGLFHMFTSPLFLAVTALLVVSIAGCTIHRLPTLWRTWRHPLVNATDRLFKGARYRASVPADPDASKTIQIARERLAARGYRVLPAKDPTALYADRFAWGGFGTVVAHLSFIIIIAAFCTTALASSEKLLTLPAGGDPVEVGQGTPFTLQATAFEATIADDGRPLDYVSHLVLRQGEAVVAEQDVRVNEPLTHSGVRFHQTTYGIGADIRVTGAATVEATVPLQWTTDDGLYSVGELALPDLGLLVEVMAPASGAIETELAAGQAAFRVFRAGEAQPMAVEVADQGQPVEVGDLKLEFEREREYTGITVRLDPGSWLMWIGSVLLIGGMTVTFMFRHRRMWVRARDGRLEFASTDKEDSGARRRFEELDADAQTWFEAGSRGPKTERGSTTKEEV